MIDKNELMLGDLVIYDHKIIPIISGGDIDLADEGCYEPIPLTEEIMELNGFENILFDTGAPTDTWKLAKCNLHFSLHHNENKKHWWIATMDAYVHIYNVHELQHLLRLCGLKYFADNFKVENNETE